jgi:hypothetical protein
MGVSLSEQSLSVSWPKGASEPAALIDITPDFISRRLKVDFQRGHDNIDDFVACVFQTRQGSMVVLQKYDSAPGPGVNVIVDIETPVALRDVAMELALTKDEILWVAPWAKIMLESAIRIPTQSRQDNRYTRRSLIRRPSRTKAGSSLKKA